MKSAASLTKAAFAPVSSPDEGLLKLFIGNSRSLLACCFLVFASTTSLYAEAQSAKDVLKKQFWGKLYKDGGESFYCGKSFKRKSAMLVPSYIYPEGSIRQHLNCGTKRQCLRDSDEYNRIASDLHNIVPAKSTFEIKRTGTVFDMLSEDSKTDSCGVRRHFHVIEPPEHLKGDIARALMYMYNQYNLPPIGSTSVLESWMRQDPPSEEELARSLQIEAIQGMRNPLVTAN